MVTVPRRWPGATVACLASGPSLTRDDAEQLRGAVPTIAVNEAVRVAPWADVLYSSDQAWFPHRKGMPGFTGQKYAITASRGSASHAFARWPDIAVLRNTGDTGLELAPTGLRTGRNSGYAAINLAVHLGASRILLLGYDLGPGRYRAWVRYFETLVVPLAALNVSVVNCSRQTALRCFPRQPLHESLLEVAA